MPTILRARSLYLVLPMILVLVYLLHQISVVASEIRIFRDTLKNLNLGAEAKSGGDATTHEFSGLLPYETQDFDSFLPAPTASHSEALLSKAVVVPKLATEDTTWLETDVRGWAPFIYAVDNATSPLHTPKNKGRESLAYLQFIVDHYNDLPDVVAFMHSHKNGWPQSWHTDNEDYSNALSLERLRTDYVQEQGFVNLRCSLEPGCPAEINLRLVPSREPPQDDLVGLTTFHMPGAWKALLPHSDIPKAIASPCCAQFAVSKQQILERDHADYRRLYDWVLNTDLPDRVSGRIMEYLWHIIFGRDPVFCPEPNNCYCQLYGTTCAWVGYMQSSKQPI